MISMTRSLDDQDIFELFRKHFPFVLLDREIDSVEADCILSKNVEAACHATQHLLHHKPQSIAFISDPLILSSNARF